MARSALSYLRLFQALLPRGKAWTRSEDSILTEFLYGQAEEFARVDGRSEDLLTERDTRYTNELLTDHETDLGLPDECTQLGETIQERRNIANTTLTRQGQQSKNYFIELAEALGFEIAITEYQPFWCGLMGAGDPCGDQTNLFYWKVTISVDTAPNIYFQAGSSQSGDPLVKSSVYDGLICRIKKYKPAHTIVNFDFDGAEFDEAFSSAFDSLPSGQESYLQGAFGKSFGLGFDVNLGGDFGDGFNTNFKKPS